MFLLSAMHRRRLKLSYFKKRTKNQMTNEQFESILSAFPGSKMIENEPFDPINHARQFLQCLYGDWSKHFTGQYFEIRLLGKGRAEQCFYHSPDDFLKYDLPALFNIQQKDDFGVYFGVCPRSHKSGKNEDITIVPSLWADIDHGGSMGKLMAHRPKPDIIVFSGRGYHAYWKLKSPAPANEMTSKILRAIQKEVGSDSVSDFARVMRLPGSLNLKDTKNPKLCKVIYGL